MKVKDIKFDVRGRFANSGPGLLLPGGYWVSKKVFAEAWRQIGAHFPALDWRVEQTAETICGEEFWKAQKFGRRIALGRCVKYFADHDILPIRVANPKKKGKRKYIRK